MLVWKIMDLKLILRYSVRCSPKNVSRKLTYLGIVNSEEQDKIVEMFLESDILPQLETMDVSAGTLKDEGAQLLLDNMDKIAHLKFINMRYNYLSKDMKKTVAESPYENRYC